MHARGKGGNNPGDFLRWITTLEDINRILSWGFIQCQQARPLSGRQRGVAEGVSLSGLSRFFARSPWDTEALAARWQERFHTQLTPVVQAELARQQEVQPKRRWRAISTR